ncbi:rod-binding protein [Elioraea rosea]|uniref:rod-binding protein n=1 Tax=Elioraea rosea TaxID=2492390 RepID=UPI0011841A50|nr:rod-binding protein [Elioraea rosea]
MQLGPNPAADAALRGTPELRSTGQDLAAMRKSAQDFEAMALGALLQPMFAGTGDGGAFGTGGKGEAAWAPMLVNEYARLTAASGGLGIGEMVLRHMIAAQERLQPAMQDATAP